MEDSYDNLNNSLLTLSSEVRYVIAPVLHDDFARQRDKIIKQRTIEQIKLFPTLPVNKNEEDRLYKEIKTRFINLKDSDIWQLCSAIANHINIFVTNDRQILGLSNSLNDKYDIRVFSLREFYKNIFYILNLSHLQNVILPSGVFTLEDTYFLESEMISLYLDTGQGERRYELLKGLNVSPETVIKKICANGSEIGAIVYEIKDSILSIKLMRFHRKIKSSINLHKSYAAHCAEELIKLGIKNNLVKINIRDKNVDDEFMSACSKLGFINGEKILSK